MKNFISECLKALGAGLLAYGLGVNAGIHHESLIIMPELFFFIAPVIAGVLAWLIKN